MYTTATTPQRACRRPSQRAYCRPSQRQGAGWSPTPEQIGQSASASKDPQQTAIGRRDWEQKSTARRRQSAGDFGRERAAGERRSQATEPALHLRSLQECTNHTRESTCTHTRIHTRNCHRFIPTFQTLQGVTNRSFKKKKNVNGTSILRYHIMQVGAESSTIRPSKHGGRRGEKEAKTAPSSRARSSKVRSHSPRAVMLPPKLSPTKHTYTHVHTHHTNIHKHEATPPTLLPCSLSAPSRRVGLLFTLCEVGFLQEQKCVPPPL